MSYSSKKFWKTFKKVLEKFWRVLFPRNFLKKYDFEKKIADSFGKVLEKFWKSFGKVLFPRNFLKKNMTLKKKWRMVLESFGKVLLPRNLFFVFLRFEYRIIIEVNFFIFSTQ